MNTTSLKQQHLKFALFYNLIFCTFTVFLIYAHLIKCSFGKILNVYMYRYDIYFTHKRVYVFVFSCFGSYPAVLKVYSLLCFQALFLVRFGRRPYGVPGFKPGLTMCKARALLAIVLLWLLNAYFKWKKICKIINLMISTTDILLKIRLLRQLQDQ